MQQQINSLQIVQNNHAQQNLCQQAHTFRSTIESAFMEAPHNGSNYNHGQNQNQQQQLHDFQHVRRNSSTGGPQSLLDQSSQSYIDSHQVNNVSDYQQVYNQVHNQQLQQNPDYNVNISDYELSMAAQNLNAQQYAHMQNYNQMQQANALHQAMSQHALAQRDEKSRQTSQMRSLAGQQARTHRVQSVNGNSSAIQRYSNLQNQNNYSRQGNGEPTQTIQSNQHIINSNNVHQSQAAETVIYPNIQRNTKSQPRTDSNGPAPGVQSNGLHSSGGSLGSHSYKATHGLLKSRTQGQFSQKQNILQMIKCPCHQKDISMRLQLPVGMVSLIQADKGRKQPILQSSEYTANCGQCGQFYAVKDQYNNSISTSGKKQMGSQAIIIKTVREKDITYKLDDPISEVFKRMRQVSKQVIANLQPHPNYLQKRVKRIDNLSYIADTLQSDNQTIHHAVILMDIYSSKMPKNKEYDTLLISLCCLLISTKYLQIKYPGADTLNDMVKKKYSADLIIYMEGVVLETIDWNLMVYSIYDYVKLFISQGCLFENEEILKANVDNIMDDSTIKERPTIKLAEHFKKYAEFFADFCMYQECFMTNDPYLLACAIVAYTRKYMGVAIIWPNELELLTQCTFQNFKNLYLIIESKYSENFPKHAKSQNYQHQILTEPVHQTAQCSLRNNIINQLQLSSGGKTQKTQNSSMKQGTSINNLNINNLLGDLKTPDKCVFDFNSIVSGNKNLTHDKFSHEKFQINSNSVEKFRIQKNNLNQKATTDQQSKVQGMVFSDNKRQSINAHSFKKMMMKNQLVNNLSDEKQNQMPQSLLKNFHQGVQQKRDSKLMQQDNREYSSQNQNQNISASMINSVTSPSANIAETENEEEVQPFKPMIIKSNSQALGGGIECKTTTKKSPSGIALEQINALKEAMNSVSIQAKMPSSTTNKTNNYMKLHIHNSLNDSQTKSSNIFSNKNITSSYGAIGVNQGPIKINQKIKMATVVSQKSSQNTGQKSQKNQLTSSSQKMKTSKTYVTQLQGKNLNNTYYQDRLMEQREQRQNPSTLSKSKNDNRNVSCTSHNQKISNPIKQMSYISGKPKPNLGNQVYDKTSSSQGIATEGSANNYGANHPQRSVMSIKNAAQVIKRKNNYQQNQTIDLRVNIKQNSIQKQSLNTNSFQNTETNFKEQNTVVNAPAIIINSNTLSKNKSFTNAGSNALQQSKAALIKMIQDKNMTQSNQQNLHHTSQSHDNNTFTHRSSANASSTNNYISQQPVNSFEEKNYEQVTYDVGGKPIHKLIKSGSQVLGKARQRPKMTRGQMLQDLNDKKDKMSQLVEAAHATRCTSNEKGSSTKKVNIEQFTQKYTNNHSQFLNAPHISSFNLMSNNSHSAERMTMEQMQDENINSNNLQMGKNMNIINEAQIAQKNDQNSKYISSNLHKDPSNGNIVPHNMIKGKNVPNSLLRRATAGTQGGQKSIGNLSNYIHNTNENHIQQYMKLNSQHLIQNQDQN